MDIARPDIKRQKRRRQIVGAVIESCFWGSSPLAFPG
jgi:hypothetical protein